MLSPKITDKLSVMDKRRSDIEQEMEQNPAQWSSLAEEYGKLLPATGKYRRWHELDEKIGELRVMEQDPEFAVMAREECVPLTAEQDALEKELRRFTSPGREEDVRNCFLEIRAAVGGNESCLFAADLFRMYSRYAETCGWGNEIVSRTGGEIGGNKEIISRIIGTGAFGQLRRESGAHRVQRVPDTESQGRLHTSVVTVAVLPEAAAEDRIEISPADLRVETFRSSGAGGQHVNTTDSAVRITHLPTGVVVECQDDRSQHKNRDQAMGVLRARIAEQQRREKMQKEAAHRRALVGSGDRSDRIRTYNFPQGRMTDHRIGLSLYKLLDIMEGNLSEVIGALTEAEEHGELEDD